MKKVDRRDGENGNDKKKTPYLKLHNQNSLKQCSLMKHFFESPYIFPRLGSLHLTSEVNGKEKKLTKNLLHYIIND